MLTSDNNGELENSSRLSGTGAAFIKNIVQQLVDLSRKNPSLNFKPGKSTITFDGSPEDLVDRFVSVSAIPVSTILSSPATADQTKTLRRLSDQSKLLREERGVEVLHVAFGLLRWNDKENDKAYSAPVALLTVELTRQGEQYTLKRIIGSEFEPNRALAELLRRHPTTRFADRDILDATYPEIAQAFIDAFHSDDDVVIEPTVHLGLFSYEKLVMVGDIEANAEAILDHPVIAALNGNPVPLALAQHGIELPTPPDLDRSSADLERVYITEADSSQQETLEAATRGLSLVVQGPPGTGKSQTIVNLIAQAMFDGKSVLFVAEKKVALDVVYDRLAQRKLGDAILMVQRDADKKRFASMLGVRHAELASNISTRRPFRSVGMSLAELNAYKHDLHLEVGASTFTPFQLYGRQAKNRDTTLLVRIDSCDQEDKDGRDALTELIRRLTTNPDWLQAPDQAIWASTRPNASNLESIQAAYEYLSEGRDLAEQMFKSIGQVNGILGPELGTDTNSLENAEICLRLVADSPVIPETWLNTSPDLAAAALANYRVLRTTHIDNRNFICSRYRNDVFDTDIDRFAKRFIGDYENFWKRWFNKSYSSDVGEILEQRLANQRRAMYAEIRHELELLRTTKADTNAWIDPHHELHTSFGHLFVDVNTLPDSLQSTLNWFVRFHTFKNGKPIPFVLARVLTAQDDDSRKRALVLADWLAKLRVRFDYCATILNKLFTDVPADVLAWKPYLTQKIESIDEAPRYFQYQSWVAELRKRGCGTFLDFIANDKSRDSSSWIYTFEQVYDASLIDFAHRTRNSLATFDRIAHERVREYYATADAENVENGASRVAEKLNSSARVQMSNDNYRAAIDIITREASKQRNVMPIRTLTRKAFDAIRVLKPCWMMSPLAVSQYLPPGQVFDLVIFDEASQMRPADAIPALSRGRQVIVVGDNKQLPPTSFFDNAIETEESTANDESADIADYESILDRCAAVLQQRMLRWHYRSRDETLISFSNEKFYNGRLVTFPTPSNRPGLGIRLEKFKSIYARGGNRQNRGEAEHVARLALDHARLRPRETLGIIAFSQAQQRAIEDALELAIHEDAACTEFFSDSRPATERVFVKNLESVQGDERDVIILSVGYGRDHEGKISYNFGPLNRSGGGRRLNVAVTRAKNEMVVVSSIDDRDLDAEKCREGGAALVRSYLHYARVGGALAGDNVATGRGVDSPFEEDVRMVLTSAGYNVHLQVGASGYRIDLAVCHPERAGEYVLAVECDGATYHGTATARDRDRLRDSVLRNFGWTIYRIWSRDWFRRRSDEITRLTAAIEAAILKADKKVPTDEVSIKNCASVDMLLDTPIDDAKRMIVVASEAILGLFVIKGDGFSKKDLSESTNLPLGLVSSALDELIERRLISKVGVGRGTKYIMS